MNDIWPSQPETDYLGYRELSYRLKAKVDALERALAMAHCLYKNDKLTRLGEHLERVTREKGE